MYVIASSDLSERSKPFTLEVNRLLRLAFGGLAMTDQGHCHLFPITYHLLPTSYHLPDQLGL